VDVSVETVTAVCFFSLESLLAALGGNQGQPSRVIASRDKAKRGLGKIMSRRGPTLGFLRHARHDKLAHFFEGSRREAPVAPL
jgi:hypothetical protein